MRSGLSPMESITIGALIVIDVHARDIVERLYKEGVCSLDAFEWISQLRYYWRDDNCRVQCVQTDFPYGYEYLGNTFRLVITPLTDMAYMTLMGAQQLNLGELSRASPQRQPWAAPSSIFSANPTSAFLQAARWRAPLVLGRLRRLKTWLRHLRHSAWSSTAPK